MLPQPLPGHWKQLGRVPWGTEAALGSSSQIIIQHSNYHSTWRGKIQLANWIFRWSCESHAVSSLGAEFLPVVFMLIEAQLVWTRCLCALMGILWPSLHGDLLRDPCNQLCKVPPMWQSYGLHCMGTSQGSLFCKVPQGSAMLYNHNNGFAIELHERESSSKVTSIQKNVVNYSCAE